MQFHWFRMITWYENQSEDVRSSMKTLLVLLFLYVAFGGRFGLEYLFQNKSRSYLSSSSSRSYSGRDYSTNSRGTSSAPGYRSNYDSDNAYTKYRQRSQQQADYSNDPRDDENYNDYSSSSSYGGYSSGRGGYSYSSYGGGGGMDIFMYMMMVAGALYAPWQAMFMMNMMGGRRRGFRRGGWGDQWAEACTKEACTAEGIDPGEDGTDECMQWKTAYWIYWHIR